MTIFGIDPIYVLIVYLVLNLIAFALFGIDKRRAIKDHWRISEATLLIAAFFGAIGALAGMELFRHKTKKLKFKLVYVFFVLHVLLWVYILTKI